MNLNEALDTLLPRYGLDLETIERRVLAEGGVDPVAVVTFETGTPNVRATRRLMTVCVVRSAMAFMRTVVPETRALVQALSPPLEGHGGAISEAIEQRRVHIGRVTETLLDQVERDPHTLAFLNLVPMGVGHCVALYVQVLLLHVLLLCVRKLAGQTARLLPPMPVQSRFIQRHKLEALNPEPAPEWLPLYASTQPAALNEPDAMGWPVGSKRKTFLGA